MPLNFQDAVTATRNLGLRYLWLDSLCIIQDDTNDWMKEAARIDRVYEGAYLTIVATSSASTREGFLYREKVPHDSVKMPYRSPEDDTIRGHFHLDSRSQQGARDIVATSWNRRDGPSKSVFSPQDYCIFAKKDCVLGADAVTTQRTITVLMFVGNKVIS